MVRIFFLPYLGNRSKSDPCSYELFCLESHILSFLKILQFSPKSPCICRGIQIPVGQGSEGETKFCKVTSKILGSKRHYSGAQNFEVDPRFFLKILEFMCIRVH